MSARVAVVGGGISGLSVTYALDRAGIDVTLFEKEKEVGGLIKSEIRDGYLVERGPNSLLNINAQLDDFCKEIGLDQDKIFQNPESKSRFILKSGRLVPIPKNPKEFIFTPLLSLKGKIRAALEPFIPAPPYQKIESVSEFVSRRFGPEILDYVVDPLIEGIYAGDPEILSMDATFPRLTVLEEKYGSLLKGFLRRKKEEKRDKRIDLFSFRNGMGTLPGKLDEILGKRRPTTKGFAVREIRRNENGGASYMLTGNDAASGNREVRYESEHVVLATPAYESARLLSGLSEVISRELRSIEYAPVAIVNFGLPLKNIAKPFNGSGCLIPKKEGRYLLGFRINSNLYPNRAPQDKLVITCFAGGMRNRHIVEESDDAIIRSCLNEVRRLLEFKGDPEFTHLFRHRHAIPQYDLRHHLKLESITKELNRLNGIYLAGNYFRGVSVWDCLSQGLEIGKSISERIRSQSNRP